MAEKSGLRKGLHARKFVIARPQAVGAHGLMTAWIIASLRSWRCPLNADFS
jgi:hypothetical protein